MTFPPWTILIFSWTSFLEKKRIIKLLSHNKQLISYKVVIQLWNYSVMFQQNGSSLEKVSVLKPVLFTVKCASFRRKVFISKDAASPERGGWHWRSKVLLLVEQSLAVRGESQASLSFSSFGVSFDLLSLTADKNHQATVTTKSPLFILCINKHWL